MDIDGRSRSHRFRQPNKKSHRGFYKPTVPSWEKEFCKVVGSMNWDVFLQKKKNCACLYPKVIEWNDIAGKEAFNDAKRRFWSQKYGIFCDIPLPDPDLYNKNEIDWDAQVDIDFCRDLDNIFDNEEVNALQMLGDPFSPETYKAIAPTGWGDDDPAVTFTASYGDLLGE